MGRGPKGRHLSQPTGVKQGDNLASSTLDVAPFTTLQEAIGPCQAWSYDPVDIGREKCRPKVGGAAVDMGTIAQDGGHTTDAIVTSGKTADLWFLAAPHGTA